MLDFIDSADRSANRLIVRHVAMLLPHAMRIVLAIDGDVLVDDVFAPDDDILMDDRADVNDQVVAVDDVSARNDALDVDDAAAAEGSKWLAQIEAENAGDLTPERLAAMERERAAEEAEAAEPLVDEQSSPTGGRRFTRSS